MNNYDAIMNFQGYYSAGPMEIGIDGPEIENGKLYMSVYHYLEYKGYEPHEYNTFNLGNFLTRQSSDYKVCKYRRQSFRINKFTLETLQNNEQHFADYIK